MMLPVAVMSLRLEVGSPGKAAMRRNDHVRRDYKLSQHLVYSGMALSCECMYPRGSVHARHGCSPVNVIPLPGHWASSLPMPLVDKAQSRAKPVSQYSLPRLRCDKSCRNGSWYLLRECRRWQEDRGRRSANRLNCGPVQAFE